MDILLKEIGRSGCTVETSFDTNQKLGDNKGALVNTSRYQKLVGNQFMHSSSEEHLEAISCMHLEILKELLREMIIFFERT
ncbi:Cysteine-rich RLK (RECEPTOR-like protein kinase) 8 [Gossypium australe]|uniref:Cysteine-rich RLK (RECEPTOR-like protein kinase) 8 n=1 Tax=Gossypium australe TaxID=47621 RepID=A0A5B6V199_9ROSI|nr:Cysteine-rich RLK (RECEPTOR-like protein kinase) 8 [Gossypium australe]